MYVLNSTAIIKNINLVGGAGGKVRGSPSIEPQH